MIPYKCYLQLTDLKARELDATEPWKDGTRVKTLDERQRATAAALAYDAWAEAVGWPHRASPEQRQAWDLWLTPLLT
jgi:hypothetical protein